MIHFNAEFSFRNLLPGTYRNSEAKRGHKREDFPPCRIFQTKNQYCPDTASVSPITLALSHDLTARHKKTMLNELGLNFQSVLV